MNTANLVAWLTCLILAFFACIIGVRNAGATLKLEKDLQRMQERVDSSDSAAGALRAAQLRRIREGLLRVREGVEALIAGGSEAPEGLVEELKALDEQLLRLDQEIAPLLGEKPREGKRP